MSILLTGAYGFVGSYMQKSIALTPLPMEINISSFDEVHHYLRKHTPESVMHLAAQSDVGLSFKKPRTTYDVNFNGTFNILESLKENGFKGRFLYISSGDVYGILNNDSLPATENSYLFPRNPYAVSKVAAEALCYQYSHTDNFHTIIARPFNHIGPGQSEAFVVSNFAKQIVEIKLELKEPVLDVGDIDVTRDFTDVRDVVEAYKLLLEKGGKGEIYNVCSGREISIRTIIEYLASIASVKVELRQDPERMRPSENRRIFGDNSKIKQTTGWEPKITLEQSLENILEYWEKKYND